MNTIKEAGSASPWQAALNVMGGSASKGSAQEYQDRFLKLLVTQMKNQDPLNPMDNAQVTSQMAQISTVSGIEKLNQTLSAFGANLIGSQALTSAELIGRGVLVPGADLVLEDGGARFGAHLAQPADRVIVTIQDLSGRAVRRVELGAQAAGTLKLAWDGVTDAGGRAASGAYRFMVEAESGNGKIDAAALRYGRVEAVAPGAQGVTLQLERFGPVQLNDVKQIL